MRFATMVVSPQSFITDLPSYQIGGVFVQGYKYILLYMLCVERIYFPLESTRYVCLYVYVSTTIVNYKYHFLKCCLIVHCSTFIMQRLHFLYSNFLIVDFTFLLYDILVICRFLNTPIVSSNPSCVIVLCPSARQLIRIALVDLAGK